MPTSIFAPPHPSDAKVILEYSYKSGKYFDSLYVSIDGATFKNDFKLFLVMFAIISFRSQKI
jgi:hypothetical protein